MTIYEEFFKKQGQGFTWNKESRSAISENDEIKPINSFVGIVLRNGSEKEIKVALSLISKYKWRKLYCSGDVQFLLDVMSIVIKEHSQIIPSLEQVTAKLHKGGGKGFSESDDWSPTPLPKREPPQDHDHDDDHGHSGPGGRD